MSYSSEVLADSPLAYYRMGEASGTTMGDSSGNGRNGTTNATTGVTGLLVGDSNTAYDFNGTDDEGNVSAALWMEHTAAITVEAMVKPDLPVSANEYVIGARISTFFRWKLSIVNSRLTFLIRLSTSGNVTVTGATTLMAGTIYHVAATYDGTTAKVYLNGVQDGSQSGVGTIQNNVSASLTIGKTGSNTLYFDGVLDEFATYSTALTSSRLLAHYNAAIGAGSPTTINGTRATETAAAFAGAVLSGALLLGGQASETDTATAGAIRQGQFITGGQAAETDVALAGSVKTGAVIAGGQATETDAALTGTVVEPGSGLVIHGGQALETDTALPGSITLGYAAADTSNRVGGRSRGGYAVATWEPPVAAKPDAIVFGEAVDTSQAFGPVTMDGTQPVYTVSTADKPRHRTRIVVGGKDVTYWRDVATPLPSYQLVSPLLYGPATLRLPQVAASFERPGHGALSWLDLQKHVKIQRVDAETGNVVATDYKGVIIALNSAGADLTVEIGGEASGRAALMEKQLSPFRSQHDIGRYAYRAFQDLGLPFKPRLGPETGIVLARFGGTGFLDYISQLCARAWTRSGNQWTIMPDAQGDYRMFRKDTATITATAYCDDARVVADLRCDLAEEPNRIFVTGITPKGQRVTFAVFPGLVQGKAAPYPFHDDRNFGVGTTNTDTDTGDGVTVMISRLLSTGYLNVDDTPGGYDADVTQAIKHLQEEADGTPVTGNMTPATWRALFDLDQTGASLQWARVLPAAQKSYTRPWDLTSSGALRKRNPAYRPLQLKRDRNIDVGSGFTVPQMREFARAEIEKSGEDNLYGTIVFHTGAIVAGDHTPGDPVTASDVYRTRRLKPGMNIKAVTQGQEITLHVSTADVGEDGKVTVHVDTRARDSMALWEVMQRNRESRKDLARQWVRQHRASGMTKDAIDGWFKEGGLLGNRVDIPGHQWEVFEVIAGQEGTVARLLSDTNPNAEYMMATFGKSIQAKRLARLIGNPFDVTSHVSSITVNDGGSGYGSAPDVTVAGGAAAHAVIEGGKVARVIVSNRGSGYTSAPSVSFSGGGGSGASATANVSTTGSDRWSDPEIRKELEDRLMLYVAGSIEEPLGYFPRQKGGGHALTGQWKDDAGFAYRTFRDPVLYVAVYADRDTAIPAGRIMWPVFEAGV